VHLMSDLRVCGMRDGFEIQGAIDAVRVGNGITKGVVLPGLNLRSRVDMLLGRGLRLRGGWRLRLRERSGMGWLRRLGGSRGGM
jgi:hypothetical protein